MVKSADLNGMVGAGKFFAHVSSRMAFALPIGHRMGLRSDSHMASNRPSSFERFTAEFYGAERATGFLGYDWQQDNRVTVAAGERVLLGTLATCAKVFKGSVIRSVEGELNVFRDAMGDPVEFVSYAKLKEVARALGVTQFLKTVTEPLNDVIPATLLPMNPCIGNAPLVEFPKFDLFATRINTCRLVDADETSWPTICLGRADQMTGACSTVFGDVHTMPMIGSCEDWLVWMRPTADIPEAAHMSLEYDVLVAGK